MIPERSESTMQNTSVHRSSISGAWGLLSNDYPLPVCRFLPVIRCWPRQGTLSYGDQTIGTGAVTSHLPAAQTDQNYPRFVGHLGHLYFYFWDLEVFPPFRKIDIKPCELDSSKSTHPQHPMRSDLHLLTQQGEDGLHKVGPNISHGCAQELPPYHRAIGLLILGYRGDWKVRLQYTYRYRYIYIYIYVVVPASLCALLCSNGIFMWRMCQGVEACLTWIFLSTRL